MRSTLHAGVFTVVQRFRSDLGLYVHLHCLITDGAFEERDSDVRFLPAATPTAERLTAVLAQVHKAVAAVAEDADLDIDPALAACVQLGLSGPHLARAVGYIRVSTRTRPSDPAQRATLERWASARNVELVGVFEDRGVSGATALDRRPGLLAALDCMAEHRAGLLVAAKRDRFARDIILAAQLKRLVERAGAKLVSTDGASDGDSPEATMLRRILDVFASFERDLIRGRTRAALATKRAKGLKFGSTAPYGWRIAGEHLEVEPGEQAAIMRVVELANADRSLRQIAAILTAEVTCRGVGAGPPAERSPCIACRG